MSTRVVASKWVKTQLLRGSSSLAKYIPFTKKLNEDALKELMHKYEVGFVKPERSSRGKGIFKISKLAFGWSIITHSFHENFQNFEQMYKWMAAKIKKRPYIIQRGIHLIQHNGRSVDFRIMVQRGVAGWEVTGKLARTAFPENLTTNWKVDGIYPAQATLQHIFGEEKTREILYKIKRISVQTARKFNIKYPEIRYLGLDVGVDFQGNIWIIEVNTRPDIHLFSKLKDPRMYRRILKVMGEYGRSPSSPLFKELPKEPLSSKK